MTATKARAIQTPGAAASTIPATKEVVDNGVDLEGAGADVGDPEKQALLAQLAEMQARLDAAEAAAAKVVKGKPATVVAAPAAAVGGAQKTEQGWIVPDSFGAPAKKA